MTQITMYRVFVFKPVEGVGEILTDVWVTGYPERDIPAEIAGSTSPRIYRVDVDRAENYV